MDLDISGKTALVTASSKGLGRAVAEALVQEEVNVMLCARGMVALEQAADAIRALGGGKVEYEVADVTRAEEVARLTQSCVKKFGVSADATEQDFSKIPCADSTRDGEVPTMF